MKIAILHSGNAGFFPRYYKSIRQAILERNDEVRLFVPNSGRNRRNVLPDQVRFGNPLNWFIHNRLYCITGIQDIFSITDTLDLIFKLLYFRPDVIHFNLINDKFLNIPLLFSFIRRSDIPVVWTMHDCRAFTGQCPYFDEIGCERWLIGCGKCPICESKIDNTHITWNIRKKYPLKLNRLTIVTPSKWLADFVKGSFLGKFPVKTIYNGVDIEGFSKATDASLLREYNRPVGKKIVLGCAINWEERKGLNFFEALAGNLPESYQIVLAGGINQGSQEALIDKGVICTGRTKTFEDLVALYQHASVFCNPTMADNFPTTNIEALASGTPIVTFNTGGSPEAIDDTTGIVVKQGDLDGLRNGIIDVVENKDLYSRTNCINRSKLFSNLQYNKYVDLFHSMKIS